MRNLYVMTEKKDLKRNLTIGMFYKVFTDSIRGDCIINDVGRKINIYIPSCAHLGMEPWGTYKLLQDDDNINLFIPISLDEAIV